jgi:hypothetical protein
MLMRTTVHTIELTVKGLFFSCSLDAEEQRAHTFYPHVNRPVSVVYNATPW